MSRLLKHERLLYFLQVKSICSIHKIHAKHKLITYMKRFKCIPICTYFLLIFSAGNLQMNAQETDGHEWSSAVQGINEDPKQKSIGSIPYEMIGRKETREPLLTFDDCTQWQVRTDQADAALYRTKEQRVVGDYSGKVVYKTKQSKAGFRVELVKPYQFQKEWDCINFWNFGNHWLWENSGEAMTHYAVIQDAKGREITIPFMQEWLWRNMNYKYWFLNHIKLNDSIARPITFIGLEFRGNGTKPNEENNIFLGPIYGYQEVLKPMKFKSFPKELPFPLRKETILPTNKLTDFKKFGSIDALNLLSKYKSYHNFLKAKENQYSISLEPEMETYLELITKIAAAGKRRIEIEALYYLAKGTFDLESDLRALGIEMSGTNLIQILDSRFYSNEVVLIENIDGKYCASSPFKKMLNNSVFYDHVNQIIELGRSNWTDSFSETYEETEFVLNMRYTYEDVCRFLNWPKNLNAQNLGGYFYHKETKTFPVFINYIKGEDVVESQKYEDRFENRNTLVALSKSNENRYSSRMKLVENSSTNGVEIHLFVRKNKNDKGSKELYYLGKMYFVCFRNNKKPVQIEYKLKDEIRQDLYDYFNSN